MLRRQCSIRRKKKSSARELLGLIRSCSFLNTLKTSLKIFYQEKLLQEKLVIDFCILLTRCFNSKTSKMSICVWKYLRKTITSTTENNLHQVHRCLEEKSSSSTPTLRRKNCSNFNSSIRKSFVAPKHLAHELLIRLRFFLSDAGLWKFSESTLRKKTSLSSHHRRQPSRSTLRKFVQHFDT